MSSTTSKVTVLEKIGYSLGDLSANLIFQTLMTFLAFFYTDVYKIPPAAASAIIFTGGMFGAFFTPVMGIIADRTQTRWGKFRPWILWTAVPFGVIALLAFSTPQFSEGGKIAYALITYILLVVVYAANNLPYGALSGVITGNMAERNSLSAYRFTAVMIAQFVVQALLLPLVLILGDGDRAMGFEKVMGIFAVTGVIFFIITFLTTRERIQPPAEQKNNIKDDLRDLAKNKPWIAVLTLTIFLFITLSLRGGMLVFYFENYLGDGNLAVFLNSIGFNNFIAGLNSMFIGMGLTGFQWPEDPSTSAFSVFNAGGIILMIIGISFSKRLADRFGKRDVFRIALFISAVCVLAFYLIPAHMVGLVFISQLLHGFFYGLTIPLLWAMVADVADYSEWKNNRRATAIVFSAIVFGLQSGISIGGALVAAILAALGYQGGVEVQPEQAVQGIKLAVSVIPFLTFMICVGCLFFYEIGKKTESLIEKELSERRAKAN